MSFNLRSEKEAGCFPYESKRVCYMEVMPNGDVEQITSKNRMLIAYCHAKDGSSRILAVWPGQWRSDLFTVDDLESFADGQKLFG